MKTKKEIEIIAAGLPALGTKLGGGLRRGKLTELVGLSEVSLPLAGHFVASSLAAEGRVGVIDCVHDLEKLGVPTSRLEIVQPCLLQDLPRDLNRFGRKGYDLILLNLG